MIAEGSSPPPFITFLPSRSSKGTPVSTPFQALELWRHALVASVRSDAPDLSARQMAILLCVYLSDAPPTVRGLASALSISKPAVSRALDRLGELGYVCRQRDDLDRRNVLVERTAAGAAFLRDFAGMILGAQKHVAGLPEQALRTVFERPAPDAPALAALTPDPLLAPDEEPDVKVDVAA